MAEIQQDSQINKVDGTGGADLPTIQPDDLNFPKLPSTAEKTPPRTQTPQFVWRPNPTLTETPQEQNRAEEKGKGKQPSRTSDSTPLTRQGYRSGRLADDFWTALNAPNTPPSQKKSLRVIPVLIKDKKGDHMEYLVNSKPTAPKYIAQVHIAELLAGVPWTEARVRQHVVNEVAQALYKVLVFTNPAANPLQKWKQGKWFASWEGEAEGEHICTLYVSALAQEHKIKPRKGNICSWARVPEEVKERLQLHSSEDIEEIAETCEHWHKLTRTSAPISNKPTPEVAATHHNRFSALRDEEVPTTSTQ